MPNPYSFIGTEKKHVHAYDGKPLKGTTTVIGEVFPPPLAYYGARKALEKLGYLPNRLRDKKTGKYKIQKKAERLAHLAEVWPTIKDRDTEELLKLMDECYSAHDTYKKEQAIIGTGRHAEIETYILACIETNMGLPLPYGDKWKEVKQFVEWATRDVDTFIWAEKCVYSLNLWTGGKIDFGFLHKRGDFIIGDNKPSIYPKHFVQTAGYGFQLQENGLFTDTGDKILPGQKPDGYFIWDYNLGQGYYRNDVDKLERIWCLAVEMYDQRDKIGTGRLEELGQKSGDKGEGVAHAQISPFVRIIEETYPHQELVKHQDKWDNSGMTPEEQAIIIKALELQKESTDRLIDKIKNLIPEKNERH